jgi:predicted restriction endonuclease
VLELLYHMSTESDINFHKLIEDDVSRIGNGGNRTKRRRALEAYYKAPNHCKHCNQVIVVPIGKKIKDVKQKIFCSHSCAASFNNIGIKRHNDSSKNEWRPKCDDETFTKAYKNNSNYNGLARELGYTTIRASLRDHVRRYITSLGLEPYCARVPTKDRTKGDLFRIRSNWQNARSAIQKMAREAYANSNKPQKCCICGYDKTYEVAHIKAVSEFDDDTLISEINNVNNLVALCPNHHWEYDNHILSNEEFII